MPSELKTDKERQELIDEWVNWEPPEEMIRENAEQHHRELMEEHLNTRVYDTGSGKKMTLRQFEKFYGTDEYSEELVEAARNKTLYSKETAGNIKRMYAGLTQTQATPTLKPKPDSKKIEPSKPKKASRKQFIQMEYGFVDKVKDADCHHNPTALLMILLKHRTWKGKMDKHHTYTYWYEEKGLIVASRGVESLAEELGTCERTVRKYLKQLADIGDIEIKKGEKFGSHRENVYVLGTVDKDGNEFLRHTMPK